MTKPAKSLHRKTPEQRAPATAAAPLIDISVAGGDWGAGRKWRSLASSAVAAAIAVTRAQIRPQSELSILLTDDETIRTLNARWRDIDKPTNVLSFPASGPDSTGPAGSLHTMLGDIVLARETVTREAALAGKPLAHHFQHLVVHGFLHLIGYDHQEDSDAERMEELERQALKLLAVPDPYGPAS